MQTNPLQQYFRQPAIFIRLPSNGQFYPPGSLTETANGEYPVLPMTTMDEIVYRTPDALFNGSAVTTVIQSCVPNIRDAWSMPSMDIDTVLTAIRIASYGHEMEISTKCPSCETESDYNVDLRQVLEKISAEGYKQPLALTDLEISFRPMTYKQMNANSMEQFEDQKILQSLDTGEIDNDKKLKMLGDVLKKITSVTTRALAENIKSVKTPTGVVDNTDFITDWLANTDRRVFTAVREAVLERKRKTELQPLHINCQNCQNKYDQVFTLNMSNFFADAS
jgi:hypothetical protein